MREIVLDTETTGLNPEEGHRVLEIGAIEIVHQVVTGRVFHRLINPERDVPQDAARVHGHTIATLKDKPVFASVVDEFLDFVGDFCARHPQCRIRYAVRQRGAGEARP